MAGALKGLIRLFKPLRRQDPIFGSMLYMQGMDYWETKTFFLPIQREIEIFVDGGEDDDFTIQRKFMQELSAKWETVIRNAREAVTKSLQEEVQATAEIDVEQLQPSFSVPKANFTDADWQLTLANENESVFVEVKMKGPSALEAYVERCG